MLSLETPAKNLTYDARITRAIVNRAKSQRDEQQPNIAFSAPFLRRFLWLHLLVGEFCPRPAMTPALPVKPTHDAAGTRKRGELKFRTY